MINDPAVRPFVGPEDLGPLDISEQVANPVNLFVMGEHGGFGLLWTAPFTREVHTFILKEGRGIWAREAAQAGIELARQHGTAILWTRIPQGRLPNVHAFAKWMGMRPTGEVIQTFDEPHDVYMMAVH